MWPTFPPEAPARIQRPVKRIYAHIRLYNGNSVIAICSSGGSVEDIHDFYKHILSNLPSDVICMLHEPQASAATMVHLAGCSEILPLQVPKCEDLPPLRRHNEHHLQQNKYRQRYHNRKR